MKKKILFLLCFLAIFFVFGMIAKTNQAKAVTQTNESGKVTFTDIVGDAKDYFGDRFIALDSNGYPHLCAYYEDGTYHGLKHAYWDGNAWQVEVVARLLFVDFGKYCSIAINKSTNDVYISFQSNTNLAVFKKTGSSWSSWGVDTDGDTGYYTSIVLTSDGTPHVFYQKIIDADNSDILHAYLSGSSWIKETVVSSGNSGWDISSAVDRSNNIHLSYFSKLNSDIRYKQWIFVNETWSSEKEVNDSAAISGHSLYNNNSISVGNDNIVKVGYLYYPEPGIFCLNVASPKGPLFASESYACNFAGLAPSIVLDDQNYPHLSHHFFNGVLNYLNYAVKSSTGFSDSRIRVLTSGDINTSITSGDQNYFISDYSTGNDNQNFVLLDSVVPTATVTLTGKSGDQFSFNMSASDYAKMGGAKYYCIDENDACNPATDGTALTSATLTGTFPASSSTIKTIYFRVGDWAGNILSTTLTESAHKK